MVFKLSIAFVALASLASAATLHRTPCPNSKNTAINPQCCVFYDLADELQNNKFDNECGEDAHEALRLTFHDAIGFSASGKLKGTGADGSIMLFNGTELQDHANDGVEDAINNLAPLLHDFKVSAGDLIQFAGAVAVSNCPGAPRLEFLAGRPNATSPAQQGTVPLPQDPVDKILARMQDAGLTPEDTVNLLSSHTVARSDTLVPGHDAVPFDTTPFTFDTQVFLEVLLKGVGVPFGVNNTDGAEVNSPLPAEGEMRLQSDFAIARDPVTACFWQDMINNQQKMMNAFQTSMSKMAILGHDRRGLYDCSEAVPVPKPPVKKPATFPATKNIKDVEQVCRKPFPTLSTDRGAETTIPACVNGDTNIDDCPS
ncbi:manganese peroxidase 1 [Fomitiporia mediterranea MF3/22]|uniref:Peroxidase n=1 Tax=Fomitiporia mediterranea (strain MF3/22) TaxID=694068 RepID=R7SHB2_FOMME|nr:manganese peroxidase 1 [Fomitiporia mediterranea MF3/22]EJC97780.1 manganese peroxidase 1 [Fomitiporia mediterranea MF3/22]